MENDLHYSLGRVPYCKTGEGYNGPLVPLTGDPQQVTCQSCVTCLNIETRMYGQPATKMEIPFNAEGYWFGVG